MKTIIRNGRIYLDGKLVKQEMLIDGKKIAMIAEKITEKADKIIDAQGAAVFPGFIDLHAHLRGPWSDLQGRHCIWHQKRCKGWFYRCLRHAEHRAGN